MSENSSAGIIVCLGEALVDFIATEQAADVGHAATFVKAPGGAMANTAAGLARLGARVRFVGKVGADPFGRFLLETLSMEDVDTRDLVTTDQYSTGIVFVALDQERVPSYIFYGYPSADMMLGQDEVGPRTLDGAAFLHLGTVSMVRRESRAASFKLMRLARDQRARISFDPNLRLHLWKDHEQLKDTAIKAAGLASLVKLNAEELKFMTGEQNLEAGARRLMDMGVDAVVVTLGAEGAYYKCADGEGRAPGFKVEVVDTTGAGDGFAAALLLALAEAGQWPPPAAVMAGAVRFANAAGAMVATAIGAMSALPRREQVNAFLAEREKEEKK